MPHWLAFLIAAPRSALSSHSVATLFMSTGIVGPLLLLVGLAALVMALRRWLELGVDRLMPLTLQKAVELKIRDRQFDAAQKDAAASRTFLGEVVGAGLRLRGGGLDEMLAHVERTTAKESMRLGNRIANLARLGGAVLLIGLLGTTSAIIATLLMIARLKDPVIADFVTGFGESLVCMALALLIALFCFGAFFLLDSRLTTRTLAIREIAEDVMHEAAAKSREP